MEGTSGTATTPCAIARPEAASALANPVGFRLGDLDRALVGLVCLLSERFRFHGFFDVADRIEAPSPSLLRGTSSVELENDDGAIGGGELPVGDSTMVTELPKIGSLDVSTTSEDLLELLESVPLGGAATVANFPCADAPFGLLNSRKFPADAAERRKEGERRAVGVRSLSIANDLIVRVPVKTPVVEAGASSAELLAMLRAVIAGDGGTMVKFGFESCSGEMGSMNIVGGGRLAGADSARALKLCAESSIECAVRDLVESSEGVGECVGDLENLLKKEGAMAVSEVLSPIRRCVSDVASR